LLAVSCALTSVGPASFFCALARADDPRPDTARQVPGPVQPPAGTYCRPFPIKRIKPWLGGYLLLEPDGRDDGLLIPGYPSPDGQAWICQRAGEPVSAVFVPGRGL